MLAAPIYMVITRYLADCIHRKDVTHTPTVMLGSIGLLYLILLPFGIFYYWYYAELDLAMRLSAIANLFLISPIWLLGVYMTALKGLPLRHACIRRRYVTCLCIRPAL